MSCFGTKSRKAHEVLMQRKDVTIPYFQEFEEKMAFYSTAIDIALKT